MDEHDRQCRELGNWLLRACLRGPIPEEERSITAAACTPAGTRTICSRSRTPKTWLSTARRSASTATRWQVRISGSIRERGHEPAGPAFGRASAGFGRRRVAIEPNKSDVILITRRPNRHTGRRSAPLERLLDRTVLGQADPELGTCWLLTGPTDPYGRIGKGPERLTHRLGLEAAPWSDPGRDGASSSVRRPGLLEPGSPEGRHPC
jgi:hypothetical protein